MDNPTPNEKKLDKPEWNTPELVIESVASTTENNIDSSSNPDGGGSGS